MRTRPSPILTSRCSAGNLLSTAASRKRSNPDAAQVSRHDRVGDSYEVQEEWYALKNFAKDMHVVLVQETAGMTDPCYQRAPYPAKPGCGA